MFSCSSWFLKEMQRDGSIMNMYFSHNIHQGDTTSYEEKGEGNFLATSQLTHSILVAVFVTPRTHGHHSSPWTSPRGTVAHGNATAVTPLYDDDLGDRVASSGRGRGLAATRGTIVAIQLVSPVTHSPAPNQVGTLRFCERN